MINFNLNNKTETRLNTHSNMQMMVSHLSRFLWDNRILSVNEMNNECDLIFFCSFPDKIL